MILLSLKHQLTRESLSREERSRILEEIQKLESRLKMD
jgi:hypothetical protein